MSFELPGSVQAVVEGPPNDSFVCTQCRGRGVAKVFRCSRCQVAHYCSQACQKQHFTFHKNACKTIATLRREEETMSLRPPVNGHVYSRMANHLVKMGYRESDTVENGRFYYRKALYYLLELVKPYQSIRLGDDDKITILLGILGADEHTIQEWIFMGAHESVPFSFDLMQMLATMKRLARYRSDLMAYEEFRGRATFPNEIHESILPYLVGVPGTPIHLDQLVPRIQKLIWSIRQFPGGSWSLMYLRDTVPFSSEHTPVLADDGTIVVGLPSPEFLGVDEYWHLVQDAFLMTPGVNDILHEFLPEDDDPIDQEE